MSPTRHAEDRTAWLVIAAVCVSGVIAALQVSKAAVALPSLQAEFNLDVAAAGWIGAVFAVLGAVAGSLAGVAVARLGDRRLLIAGMLTLAVGSVAGAVAHRYSTLLATRAIEGCGFLLAVIAAPVVLQRTVTSRNRERVFALWSAFMPTGMAIALVLGALLTGWRGAWVLNGGLAAAAAILLAFIVPRNHGGGTSVHQEWRSSVRDALATVAAGRPALLATIFGIYGFLYFAVVSFLPVLLIHRMGLKLGTASIVTAIALAANIVGNLSAGRLMAADRQAGEQAFAGWKCMALASAAMTVSAAGIFTFTHAHGLVFALCLVFCGFGGLLPAAVISAAPGATPEPRLAPLSVGLVMQGNYVGQLAGPAVVGSVVQVAGWSGAALPIAAVGAGGVLLSFLMAGAFGSTSQ